ncbi:Hypothetical predicted protein, partial [Mytilus galloprovincialis]
KQLIDDKIPASFKLLFPSTRVVVDCTEIQTERPSSLSLGSKCYSSYISRHTWKGLVGITPPGAVTFIYSLYTGCMSDVEITKLCGMVDLLEMGDFIMADKGFVLNKVLEGTGITVNTPPFLMNHFQCIKGKGVPPIRQIIPLSMVGTINQLWTVADMLTLFRG